MMHRVDSGPWPQSILECLRLSSGWFALLPYYGHDLLALTQPRYYVTREMTDSRKRHSSDFHSSYHISVFFSWSTLTALHQW